MIGFSSYPRTFPGGVYSTDIIDDIIAEVAAGRMVFPFLDVRKLRQDPMSVLTRRERVLLTSLAQGRTNKELAADLNISLNTVKFHLRNLFEKLSVNNRAQAIAFQAPDEW